MPNHVYSTLRVAGETESVKQFVQATMEANNLMEYLLPLDPAASVPIVINGEEFGTAFAQADRDGVDGYRMALDLWGTKWATYEWEWLEAFDVQGDGAVAQGRFTTAWGEAIEGWERISAMFPTLTFVTTALEEQPAFAIVRVYHRGQSELIAALDCEGGPAYDEDNEDEWEELHSEWERQLSEQLKEFATTVARVAAGGVRN